MALHKNLLGADLHEPKGANTAQQGSFYRSDGLGKGTWEHLPTGYGHYQSLSTQSIPSSYTKFICNSLGAGTVEDFLPSEIRGVTTLWDGTSGVVVPIRVGDVYSVQIGMDITAKASAPTYLEIAFDKSGSGTPSDVLFTSTIPVERAPTFSSIFNFTFQTTSSLFTNGGQFFMRTDVGLVDITNPSITLTRVHGEM